MVLSAPHAEIDPPRALGVFLEPCRRSEEALVSLVGRYLSNHSLQEVLGDDKKDNSREETRELTAV